MLARSASILPASNCLSACRLASIFLSTYLWSAMPTYADIVIEFDVNIAGWESNGLDLGEAGSTVETFVLAPNAEILSVDYTIDFDAFSPSALGEFLLTLENSAPTLSDGFWSHGPTGINLNSGNFVGSGSFTTTDPNPDFDPGGPFSLLEDGILRIGAIERFADSEVAPDARVNSGTLTITYRAIPEPGSLGLGMLIFGMPLTVRRRRVVRSPIS